MFKVVCRFLLVLYCSFIYKEGIVPYLKDVWEDVPNKRSCEALSHIAVGKRSIFLLGEITPCGFLFPSDSLKEPEHEVELCCLVRLDRKSF